MDRIDALIAVAHLKLRLEILQRHPEYLEMATPNLQGLAEAMKKLEFGLEAGAGKLLTKVQAVGARGEAALAKGHVKIDSKAALVAEIESYVSALEGANGGDPLDDLSEPSAPLPGPNGGPRIL